MLITPDFYKLIGNIETTKFKKDKDLIEFPRFGSSGKQNLLYESTILYTDYPLSVTANITRKGMKVKAELLNQDGSGVSGWDFGFSFIQGGGNWWLSPAGGNPYIPTFTSDGQGYHDGNVHCSIKKIYRLNVYERDFVTPTRTRLVTIN